MRSKSVVVLGSVIVFCISMCPKGLSISMRPQLRPGSLGLGDLRSSAMVVDWFWLWVDMAQSYMSKEIADRSPLDRRH